MIQGAKMIADIQIPPILKVGAGAVFEVPAILRRLGCDRPLIVTDTFLVGQGFPAKLRNKIIESGIGCEIFSGTVPDPTTDAVEAGVRAFTAGNHDSLVSFGGGSPIDTAPIQNFEEAQGVFS